MRTYLPGRSTLLVVLMLIAGAVSATAQPCDENSIVQRIAVVLSTVDELESDQLFATLRDQPAVPMKRDAERGRWYIDLNPPLLKPVPFAGIKMEVSKFSWLFTRRSSGSMVTAETAGVAPICTAVLAFDASRAWKVRVVSEPSETVVPVDCERRACIPGSRTEFVTVWMAVSDPLVMVAQFGSCKVRLQAQHHGDTRFAYTSMLRRFEPGPCWEASNLARAIASMPRAIAISPVSR